MESLYRVEYREMVFDGKKMRVPVNIQIRQMSEDEMVERLCALWPDADENCVRHTIQTVRENDSLPQQSQVVKFHP